MSATNVLGTNVFADECCIATKENIVANYYSPIEETSVTDGGEAVIKS
jgi:hypothetical protein